MEIENENVLELTEERKEEEVSEDNKRFFSSLPSPGQSRHCAWCLNPIAPENVKHCSKCHRRAYCSRGCQAKDWKPRGKGQGHKNWCLLDYGEEDIDWEVISTVKQGRAVIAKRNIPALSRIMVDGYKIPFNISAHPEDLCSNLGRSIVTNHRCDPNSGKFPMNDEAAEIQVLVVYSMRDIQEGEEITSNYTAYNETSYTMPRITGLNSLVDYRRLLKSKWGITCPPDCFCYDEEIEKIILESRESDLMIADSSEYSSVLDVIFDLHVTETLLKNHERIRSSIFDKARILMIRFNLAVQQNKTLPIAQETVQEIFRLYSKLLHPDFILVQRYKKWMTDVSTHPDYLKFQDQEDESFEETYLKHRISLKEKEANCDKS